MSGFLTLATAGLQSDQLADTTYTKYPRVDYIELQHRLPIDVLDYTKYDQSRFGGLFRTLETRIHSDLYLSVLGMLARHKYDLVFAMSERVGIPFAFLNRLLPQRKKFVSMFQCWSPRQEAMITRLNLLSAMDAIAVHCQSMKRHLVALGAPAEHVHVLPYSVDHHFFTPQCASKQQPGLIMSVGEIRSRDYGTLFRAVEGLPVKLVVAASGSWYAREKTTELQLQIPDNVTVTGRLSRVELRELYAQSQFVVLPVHDTVFSAGSTGSTESACMERAVIATRTQGIVDFVVDGKTGVLVAPHSVEEMRSAIEDLMVHPEKARRFGKDARQRVEEELNLDIYVEKIAQLLERYL